MWEAPLNTHLEDGPEGELSRVEGSKLIVARLAELQAGCIPAVVTGDFNSNPGSAAYRVFMESGFVDSYLAAGNADGAAPTFHGLEGERYSAARYSNGADTFWRVDWILTRAGSQRVRTDACAIVRDAEPPTYPSDHYPVLAELMLPGE